MTASHTPEAAHGRLFVCMRRVRNGTSSLFLAVVIFTVYAMYQAGLDWVGQQFGIAYEWMLSAFIVVVLAIFYVVVKLPGRECLNWIHKKEAEFEAKEHEMRPCLAHLCGHCLRRKQKPSHVKHTREIESETDEETPLDPEVQDPSCTTTHEDRNRAGGFLNLKQVLSVAHSAPRTLFTASEPKAIQVTPKPPLVSPPASAVMPATSTISKAPRLPPVDSF